MNWNPQTGAIGDLMLTFGEGAPSLPARFSDAPWGAVERGAGWQLWVCAPSPDWKGFPVHATEGGGWRVLALGEFDPAGAAPFDPARLPRDLAAFPGRCLVFAHEAGANHWHIWTDRFGTLHVYHAAGAVSTFSPAVAAFTPRALDWGALVGFFGFGFFPTDHTHFEGIRILRPATHTVLDERGEILLQERTWQWRHQPDASRSFSETVDEFARVFEGVMSETLEAGRVALPLSGGLDSRSTAAAIPPGSASADRCWAYAYGYSDDSIETRIAAQVAAARWLPFQAFTIQPYLFDDLARVLAWTEGFQDVTQARQASVRDQIADRADCLVGALWGDVWLDQAGLGQVAAGDISDDWMVTTALQKMRKRGSAWLLERLARPRLGGADPEALLADWIKPEMTSLAHLDEPDFRLKAFKTEQWSFRWSLAPVRVFQSAAWARLVFYNTHLTDFLCSVPTAYLAGRRLQIEYLKRRAPDLARIKWQVYDADLYHYQRFNTWGLPARALRKAARILSGRKILERNWEVQFLRTEERGRLIDALIHPGQRLHEFITPGEVKTLLVDFFTHPDAANGYSVSMLFTFAAWLERYG